MKRSRRRRSETGSLPSMLTGPAFRLRVPRLPSGVVVLADPLGLRFPTGSIESFLRRPPTG